MATVTIDARLSPSQAARRLEVSSEQVRKWVRAGRLGAEQTVLGYLIHADDVEALRREREANPTSHMKQTGTA